jgi:AraC-like DNA-binding protein
MSDQGTMTSHTLTVMLRDFVATLHPTLNIAGLNKLGILEAVHQAAGWQAVLALGRAVRHFTSHPVLHAVTAQPAPATIVERWLRLERFGHTRNRTQCLTRETQDGLTCLTLRHVANDGGTIQRENDLFIWGIFIGLLEGAGVTDIDAELIDTPFWVHGASVEPDAVLPAVTHTLRLRGRAARQSPPVVDSNDPQASVQARLAALIRADHLTPWKLDQAAKVLGLSGRSLQRALRDAGTTFSGVTQRTRAESALTLLRDPRLKLTDIAFCLGFADQAHFTRTFRKLYDVPPSALRALER